MPLISKYRSQILTPEPALPPPVAPITDVATVSRVEESGSVSEIHGTDADSILGAVHRRIQLLEQTIAAADRLRPELAKLKRIVTAAETE